MMKAIISIYKSDIMEYMKENDIKKEDVYMMCSNADVSAEKNKEKFDEVVLLSAPMGVPANVPYLESVLLKKKAPVKSAKSVASKKPAAKKPAASKPAPKPVEQKEEAPKPKEDGK